MKNQTKFNKSKLVARGMILVFLLTSAASFFGCYFGPTLSYNWSVETHSQFVQEIERFNSVNDGSVNTFISFDLEDNKDVSYIIYKLSTIANDAVIKKNGLHDEVCNLSVDIIYFLKSNTENNEHSEHAYKVNFHYGGYHQFSNQDKIEIRHNSTPNCQGMCEDAWYKDSMIYKNAYYYNTFVNDLQIGCIHISSIDEASEEKLDEIIQMLYDSLVIINTGV